MGVSSSSYPNSSCSPRFGGSSQAQRTHIGTTPYGQQGSGCETKLYGPEQRGPDRPPERRKKTSSLATLRRRFIKRRKSGRSVDHARQMRELLSDWEVRDVAALVEEYEGTAALKELSLQADLARPEARSLRRDLGALYERRLCADMDLVFQGACFPVHRAILAARCPLFRKLLPSPSPPSSSSSELCREVLMDTGLVGVDAPMFSVLMRYLYTGELGASEADAWLQSQNADILVRLSEEFGTPNPLEADMRGLFDRMCYYDSLLSFSTDSGPGEGAAVSGGAAVAGCSTGGGEELRAHKALLAARSPFFRNLLQRRRRSGEEAATSQAPQGPTRIVLDESIIPKKYARVILHCMYTDAVDLSLVLHSSPSTGSLGEVQALVAGKAAMTRAEEAMELYHIALFLEFSMLAQGCEDIVVDSISLESVVSILRWSSQPYGSKWVHRQAVHFLCEEFSQVATSDTLYELGQEHLLAVIQSDYLQASEQDILKYVVKWGEHQLIKRMADREPNLLSSTAHSVNKRGVKRRDLDPEELKEILSPLLPCVRLEHILPANSEVLSDTMKRGLISTPPSDMLPTAEGGRANSWLQLKSSGIYLRPRLFSPYAEEAKAALDEMMVEHTDLVRLRMVRMSNVPDTLYMVNNATPQCCHMTSHPQTPSGQAVPPSVVANEIPVPRLAVVKQMTGRLQELRRMDLAQRAYSLSCGEGSSVSHALQLRVLREFGLPDGAAELLQSPHKFFPEECFGDESPVLALRQSGRCQASSQAVLVEGVAGFHPPLPPPPPPYHPPATPGHGHTQLKAGWRPGVHPHPPQPPSRSFSYPCNPPFLPWRPTSKQGSPAPQSDCTDPQVVARPSYPGQQGHMEPAVSELMPDVAVAVSSLSLREGPESKGHDPSSDTPSSSTSVPQYYPPGLCHASLQHGHHQGPHQKHGAEPDSRAGFPDLYTLPCHPASRHAAPNLQAFCVAGPDLYSHNHARPPGGPPRPSLHPDLALGDPLLNKMEMDTPCGMNQTRPLTVAAETQRLGALENMGGGVLEGAASSRDHRSPSKPEYTYRKSAL